MLGEAKHPRSFTEEKTAATLRCAQGDKPSAVSLSSVTRHQCNAPPISLRQEIVENSPAAAERVEQGIHRASSHLGILD
jgi:hypothetical protein